MIDFDLLTVLDNKGEVIVQAHGHNFRLDRSNGHVRASIGYEWKCWPASTRFDVIYAELNEYTPGRWMAWTHQL